jgi:uncharacterized protein involved in exopolysaccharide biosynthesis
VDDVDEQAEGAEGSNNQAEMLRSYLAFARRAIAQRWRTALIILGVGFGLTAAAGVYLPRTFSCTTVLMALGNPVLDSRDTSSALTGASDLIMRHENLEAMIKELDLVRNAEARRPPLLSLKDRIMRSLLGDQTEKVKIASLVGTLENKITVTAEKGDLSIKAEWNDGRTAADLAGAARESFIKARHTAEISAFEEKMAILDGYAGKLRVEIGDLAQQLNTARDQKLNEVRAETQSKMKDSAAAQPRVAPPPVAHHTIEADTQTPALREKLTALKAKLATAEADHDRRVAEQQSKFEEMKLRLTALHPEVITQGERVAMAQQIPSELALMRSEVKDIQDELTVRESLAPAGSGQTGGGFGAGRIGAAAPGADVLPPDINDLLQRDNLDPALTAQLSGSVMKYTTLRNDLLSTRIDLDTAQAAFNHRYQVIVPAEVPTKADKPKPALIWGAGLILALILSMAVPVLSELRRGVIIERWQVQSLQLPVLAELRLPPHSPD